jgi:hypothetical protein
LEAAGIPYMVIGGQAVLVHGLPRLTHDIDVTLGLELSQVDRILALLPSLGLEPLVEPRAFAAETMVVPCRHRPTTTRVDFILSDSPYEREAIASARLVPIEGKPVRFTTVEDLVIHKVIAGRSRDVEDVRGLLIRNPALDRARVRRWLKYWGPLVGDDLVKRFDDIVSSEHG